MSLEALREEWIRERPRYDAFVTVIRETLEQTFRAQGIPCSVFARAKEIDSLVKKAILKNYTLEQIGDRAGARVIITYPDHVPQSDQLIERVFQIHERDDKAEQLGERKLGYLGIHYSVSLHSGQEQGFEGIRCEVQLHTKAQNLWSDTAHNLAYKPAAPVPAKIRRAMYRLIALVELFDDQIATARQVIRQQPGFHAAQTLDQLEKYYYRLTAKPHNRELSLYILDCIDRIISEDFSEMIAAFVTAHDVKLREIFTDYRDDQRCTPLLFQPESLFLFWALEQDPYRLKDEWNQKFPPELLEGLATVWGTRI